MCWGRRYRDYWISCLVNPSAGREHLWGGDRFEPAGIKLKVLVVGGGPAGLEAARVAAERGHEVTLVEAGPELGGQFRLAGLQPRRGQITELIGWYERSLRELGVRIDFNSLLDAGEIRAFGTDRVVIATGSLPADTGFQKALPHYPRLPGIECGNTCSVEDVMMRATRIGKSVIVLDEGGNWRGCGTAWKLAEDGHDVTLVTPDPLVGRELQRSATDFPLRRKLADLGVEMIIESGINHWGESGADVVSLLTGETRKIRADTLVLATTNRADTTLCDELDSLGTEYILIGDAAAPRQAAFAFYEGRKAGLEM